MTLILCVYPGFLPVVIWKSAQGLGTLLGSPLTVSTLKMHTLKNPSPVLVAARIGYFGIGGTTQRQELISDLLRFVVCSS